MTLKIAAKFARRELRGGLRGFRVFLACLALGVAAIAAVGSVRSAIEAGLTREGSALLGGDAEIEFTYRFASDPEKAWMEKTALRVSELADFRSMIVVDRTEGSDRAMTQLKAVDSAYPLVGSVKLSPDIPLETALAGQNASPGVVMDPLLIDQLELTIGDSVRIGTQPFVLMAALTYEPDSGAAGFALGPRSIVALPALENAGLLAPGTLYSTKYRLTLPPGTDLAATQSDAETTLVDSGLRWRDSRNGAPGLSAFVNRMGAFLVLIGLSGLAVGGVGVSAVVRAYLAQKTNVIATLRTLGASRSTIFQTYFLQIGALSLLGIAIGVFLGGAAPLLLGSILSERLPVPAVFTLHARPLIEAAIYGLLTALLFTLWPLARTGDIRAATLFREATSGAPFLPPLRYVFATAGILATLIATAAWFSGNIWLTLWTAGGIAGALILLALAAFGIRALSRTIHHRANGSPALRWALAAIGGAREEATSVVLSLGLGLSVLAAVGQIDGNLRNAISGELPDIAPSYFFVDIQKDQIDGFQARLDANPSVTKVESAPMLRGIITKINDRPAAEVVGDHWVIRGDRGVTYAAAQPDTTTLSSGTWWPSDYTGPPQISFAAEEAEEMGLTLNDRITVNILGRDITGTITSFREVDFSTAGMGFVMAMNESALAGAPHSFIATVYADAPAEAAILRELSDAYPNITAIRVRDAIDRVSDVLAGLASATSWGASATLLTGFLVLIGASAAGEPARTYEAAVLRTLGASRRRILTSFALRSALLGASAGAVALVAGITGGWAVSHFIMETKFAVIWPNAIAIVLGGIIATLLAGLAFAWRPMNVRPAQILRSKD